MGRNRKERDAVQYLQDEAALLRRATAPTIDEQISDRLDAIIRRDGVSPEVAELARLIKLHVTGSEW